MSIKATQPKDSAVKKIEPGSELHFALLGAPMGWNFLTGKDYADMQAFAKAVWNAAQSADAVDAKRYRYMRKYARFENRNGPGLYWYLQRFGPGDEGEALDACIDANLFQSAAQPAEAKTAAVDGMTDAEIQAVCPYSVDRPQAVIWCNGYRAAIATQEGGQP